MISSWTLAAAVLISLIVAYVSLLVYRVTFHPLAAAKIPGPFVNKLTGWPQWLTVLTGRRHLVLYQLHQRFGPVVRFAPNSVSINSATALHEIYGQRKANVVKADWYKTVVMAEQGVSTFTASDPAAHGVKRRLLSHGFSEKALHEFEQYVSANVNIWLDRLGADPAAASGWTAPKNVATLINYLVFDILTDLAFGRSFELLSKPDLRFVAALIPGAVKSVYELGYHPFSRILRQLLFGTPLGDLLGGQDVADMKRLNTAAKAFLAERRDLELSNEKSTSASRKDFFHYLFRGKDPETGQTYTNASLTAESQLLIVAGGDTTSTTLGACIFYLLRNPAALGKLRTELQSNFKRLEEINYSGTPLPTLPYLRAVIDESLRQCPPVGGHIPREVVGSGMTVDGIFYPPGTTIGVSVYALHHNEEYFPDPYVFKPERWIVNEKEGITQASVAVAQSAFSAFSIGHRGCIGKNLAYMELSLAVARCVWRFDMEEVKGWEAELSKGYTSLNGEYAVADHFVAENNGPMVTFRERQQQH